MLAADTVGHVPSSQDESRGLQAAEFFAGIGLVRLGLEAAGVEVAFANDIEPSKHEMYVRQFGDADGTRSHFAVGDIAEVDGAEMPDVDIAWASFPCTDLSLAGNRRGLEGTQSGTFWQVARVLREMGERRPAVVALENVTGLATSHGGADLIAAIRALNDLGYSADVLTLDARRFVPQSRPRLFIVGAQQPPAEDPAASAVSELRPSWLQTAYDMPGLRMHRAALPDPPAMLSGGLGEVVERGSRLDWWDETRTARFLDSLSASQAERLRALTAAHTVSHRTAYRRTRHGVAVWEIRPDDVAGCLRTARGGSSKQAVVRAGRGEVRVRWMTPLEYARLMGAGGYAIEGVRANQVLFGFGDAVCVPVVGWLAEHYLVPLARGAMAGSTVGAAARPLQAV